MTDRSDNFNQFDERLSTLRAVLYPVDLGIALITLVLAVLLGWKKRQLRSLTVFRVIVAMQAVGVLKSLEELIFQYVETSTNTGCRILTTLALVLAITPLYLSCFCTVYFQLVFVCAMPKSARRIRIFLIATCVILSVVPESMPLFIPPHVFNIETYCDYREAPSTRLFVFKWFNCYIWILLATIVGIVSMITTVVTIAGRSNDVVVEAALSGSTLYMEQRRRKSSALVIRTLKSVVWFPVIPIVALGFSTAYSIVQYKTGRRRHGLDVVDQVLQFLQVPFMATTFYASPPVRRAFREWRDGDDKFSRRDVEPNPLEHVLSASEGARMSRMALQSYIR